MSIPVLHTPAGSHIGMAAVLLAEKLNVQIELRVLQPINLKEKIYKWGSGMFPQLQVGNEFIFTAQSILLYILRSSD
jgi:hypothetical protein